MATNRRRPLAGERGNLTTSDSLKAWQPGWLTAPNHDPARAVVVYALRALVASGEAAWTILESGDIQVTCVSGAVLQLRESGVTRIQ